MPTVTFTIEQKSTDKAKARLKLFVDSDRNESIVTLDEAVPLVRDGLAWTGIHNVEGSTKYLLIAVEWRGEAGTELLVTGRTTTREVLRTTFTTDKARGAQPLRVMT